MKNRMEGGVGSGGEKTTDSCPSDRVFQLRGTEAKFPDDLCRHQHEFSCGQRLRSDQESRGKRGQKEQ